MCLRNEVSTNCVRKWRYPFVRSWLHNYKHIRGDRKTPENRLNGDQEEIKTATDDKSGTLAGSPRSCWLFFSARCLFLVILMLNNSRACCDVSPQAWEVLWQQVWATLSGDEESLKQSYTGAQLRKDQATCFRISQACKETFLLPNGFFFFSRVCWNLTLDSTLYG